MLTVENNQLLCFVDAGTPMGALFRSIWLPALPSTQVDERAGPPVRIKLLGEELVAFRDGDGEVGIVQAKCAHRLAPLFYGKVEQQGIRCAYHGWLYDRSGQCHEIPSEGGPCAVARNMKLKAYPVVEKAGIVWIYMGEDTPPALPKFPWIDLPREQRMASVWLQETNWLQGAEGEIDSSHVSVLHKSSSSVKVGQFVHQPWTFLDPRPKLSTFDTRVGFMSVARRHADSGYYWRVTQWMAPMFSLVPSAVWPVSGRAWVPMDNENTYTWDFSYLPDAPIPEAFLDSVRNGEMFPPACEYRSYRLNTGSFVDTWVPHRTMYNNYLVDREMQRGDGDTTGVHGVNDQDRAMQEGMGRLSERNREKLVASDLTVVTARRKLLDIVRTPEGLKRFREVIADGRAYDNHPVDDVNPAGDSAVFLGEHDLV